MDLDLKDDCNQLSNEHRVAYYLGSVLDLLTRHPLGKEHPSERIFVSRQYDNISDVSASTITHGKRAIECHYIEEVVELLKDLQDQSIVPVLFQDNRKTPFTPLIVKSRSIGSPNATLLKLYQRRHWVEIDKVYHEDCHFQSKKDMAIWRGASTGYWGAAAITDITSQRYNLFVNWAGDRSGLLDLGMTQECQWLYRKLSPGEARMMKGYYEKPKMTREDILRYKYIISLEGNDVSSGLNWILASASVPIMPVPSAESWLMEGNLKPWIHFAPIQANTSDLLEVIEILQENPDLANSIAMNGKQYMRKFLDHDNERQLSRLVLQNFIKRL